jgi:hypothetical protein
MNTELASGDITAPQAGIPEPSGSAFDAAYWAHQPPEVRELRDMTDANQRLSRASDLAMKGFTIDVPIMAWAFDPYYTMRLRRDYGFTWVPSALQPPVSIAPSLTMPGTAPYDPNAAPPGSIKVSLDPADYPPFNPPAPPAPAPVQSGSPVGDQSVGNIYHGQAWDSAPDGTVVVEPRGKFLKHRIATPFGFMQFWEKIG